MGNPKVAMRAELESKLRQKYEKKLAEAIAEVKAEFEAKLKLSDARYRRRLDIALQQASDAALMAADDTFDVNEYSAEKFYVAHVRYVNQMASALLEDWESDHDVVHTKADIDRRLKQIVGETNFAPWEERYGDKTV